MKVSEHGASNPNQLPSFWSGLQRFLMQFIFLYSKSLHRFPVIVKADFYHFVSWSQNQKWRPFESCFYPHLSDACFVLFPAFVGPPSRPLFQNWGRKERAVGSRNWDMLMKAASSQKNSSHCLFKDKARSFLLFFLNFWQLKLPGYTRWRHLIPPPFLFKIKPSRNTGGPPQEEKHNLRRSSHAAHTASELLWSPSVISSTHNVSSLSWVICKTDGSSAMQQDECRHFLSRIQIEQ